MEKRDPNSNPSIDRRDFLKIAGTGALASAASMLAGCNPRGAGSAKGGGALGEVPKDQMTYRINPRSKDKVSLLGYGCMRWPMRKKADGSGDEIDQEATNELVDYAIEHGVNYFDTAPVYIQGQSETATGKALKRHPREKFFVATKMSNFNDPSKEASLALYENSFRSLQVDYIDYYLLHNVGRDDGMPTFRKRFLDNGLLDFLLEEKKAGRIRNLGWSFHGDVKVFDYLLSTGIPWDFCMIQLNYQDWKYATGRNIPAEYLYGELVKHNVPAIIMEPLLGGRLARVPEAALAMMKAARPEASAAQWAFRYAATPPNVLTVLSGMSYQEHLQENIRTYAPLQPISEEENELLARVAKILVNADYIQCTECQYCMPCPYGLDIPGTFAHYNRCVSAGNVLKSAKDENYRKARREFLIGYNRKVAQPRQASHCIECGECLPKCPQRIPIPQELRRVDQYIEQLKQNLAF